MGASSSSIRVRALFGVMIASAMLVLMAPSIAFAANTASFSSTAPKSGSYTQATAPKLSVTVYDKYGAKRTGITVYLDGRKVSYICGYIVSGSWNPRKPDYRRFKLTYQVPSSLLVGAHTVTVKVRDLKGKNSSYSWKFYVDSATAPASFSSMTPEDASSSLVNLPRISATVAERWDVKGTGSYSMTIDGATMHPSITYTTSGQYRNFKVWYQCAGALSVGSHSVTVSVKDAAGRTTSKTWSFTVRALPPVYAEMPVDGASCSDCHTGFPAAHPTQDCSGCHGTDAPPRPASSLYAGTPMTEFTPSDVSAHTLGCFLEAPCHGGSAVFPHTIGNDCARCHNPAYPAIPQAHAVDATAIKNLHASDPTFCTAEFCHSSSLTAEHYRHTGEDGEKLSCGTCHASTDVTVIAAIAAGDTACRTCHTLLDTHPDTTTAHAAVGSCVRSGCHSPSVTAVHKNNCLACHAEGVIPSTNCGGCHATGTYHAGMAGAHALSTGGCVTFDCHGVGLGMDAALTHKNNCTRCHNADAEPSLDCVSCHTDAVLDLHPEATAAHTPPEIFCTTSNCHGTDVAATHAKSERGCTVCHAEGATASTTCSTCHSADLITVHEDAVSAHNISGNSCVGAGCHVGTDAAALHNEADGPGCIACHAVGATPTLVCETCHEGGLPVIHAAAAGNHTSTTATCIVNGCHLSDVTEVHKKSDGSSDCVACHTAGRTLSSDCTSCHTQGIVATHASADDEHAVPSGFCVTACHASNAATIHEGNTSCIACHNPEGHSPSTTCVDCHTGTPNDLHAWAIAGHVSANPSCQLPGCHSTDLVTVHARAEGNGCAACHSTESRPAKVACGVCHPGDVSTLHTKADASHAVPEGVTCDDAPQCHASNVSVIHAKSASDCAACHATNVTPSTNCPDCHEGSDEYLHRLGDIPHAAPSSGCVSADCHRTDVSTIHNPGPSCAACHAADRIPSVNCSAAGCHPTGIAARHAEVAGVEAHDIASGGCVTDGCHGTTAGGVNVAALHASGPGCIACHADDVTASVTCSDCHSTDLSVVHTRGNAYHTAPTGGCDLAGASSCHSRDVIALHGVPGGPGCAACHAPGATPTARCADCHTGQFWGTIHPVGTKHTPAEGTCVTSECHAIDVATIHSLNPPTSGPGCTPCHRVGSLTLDCTSCHTINMTPRHAAQDVQHTAAAGLCVNSTCHGSDSGVNVATLHWQSDDSCANCHADDTEPSTTCVACHTEDPLTFHTVGTKHLAPTGTCVADGCHGTTAGGVDVATLHASGPSCVACHGPGKTPSLSCGSTGCHAAVPATEHAKFVNAGVGGAHRAQTACNVAGCHTNADVSVIHAGAGCQCHNEGKTLTLSCDTFGCHPEGFPAVHNAGHNDHAQSNNSCSSAQCHYQAVDTIHSAVGGPKCAACHSVPAGPTGGTARCTSCHVGALAPSPSSDPSHPTSTTPDATHTVSPTGCTQATCHNTNIVSLHAVPTANHPTPPRCMACHGTGVVTTKVCADCHPGGFTSAHPAPAAKHTAVTGNCVKSGCHATDVVAIHSAGVDPPVCDACHGNPAHGPTLDCTVCHFSNFTSDHPVPPIPHTSSDSCTALCHATNVATLHNTVTVKHPTPPECAACHDGVKTLSTVCATCHTPGTYHPGAGVAHTASGSCIGTGCHTSDVTQLHVRDSVQHCEACHAVGKSPTTNCLTAGCHAGATSGHTAEHASCNPCHTGWHYGITGPQVPNGACANCHGSPFTQLHGWTHNNGCNTASGCHHTDNCSTSACHHHENENCYSCHHESPSAGCNCHPSDW